MFLDRFKNAFKKKSKEELDAHYDGIELEKGDFLAMLIAAVITFVPIILVILLVLYGAMWLLFLR